jgi:hypothetical protein
MIFGSATIMSDYHSEKPFQARIGSFPYIPPGLDLALPAELDLLPKSDTYSYGLVIAAFYMNRTTPF